MALVKRSTLHWTRSSEKKLSLILTLFTVWKTPGGKYLCWTNKGPRGYSRELHTGGWKWEWTLFYGYEKDFTNACHTITYEVVSVVVVVVKVGVVEVVVRRSKRVLEGTTHGHGVGSGCVPMKQASRGSVEG